MNVSNHKHLYRRVKTLQHRVNKVPKGKSFKAVLDERIQELEEATKQLEAINSTK